ncbi:hypothetical protein EVAR_55878_1 [Eumeta japonica]|uniref:Uncharacterized protein n=1 Tax=Eumeta variegata TaxID=151549 RepID=A0A4C1YKZ9_EUMVA|nr:hypothetical protein EVAR_55878_1 [Eumeta japonica]
MAVRICASAVAHIGGSEGFDIGRRSRHDFPQNIGRRFLPYKATNLFPDCVLGNINIYIADGISQQTYQRSIWLSVKEFAERKRRRGLES